MLLRPAFMRRAVRPWAFLLAFGMVVSVVPANALAQQDTQKPPRLSPRLSPRLRPAPAQRPTDPAPSTPPAAKPKPSLPETEPGQTEPRRSTSAEPSTPPAREKVSPQPRRTPPSSPPVFPPPVLGPQGTFLPPVLPAYKRLPPPAGYVEKRTFNYPLLYGGAATLVLTYGLSLIYGGSNDFKNGLGGLAAPLIGPWLAIGQRNFNCPVVVTTDIDQSTRDVSRCVTKEAQAVGVLVGLGIGQMIGGVLLTVGLLDRKKSWLRADLAGLAVRLDAHTGPWGTSLVATGSF